MHTEQLNTCMSLLPFAKNIYIYIRGEGDMQGVLILILKWGGGTYPKNLNKQQPLQSCIKTDKGKDSLSDLSPRVGMGGGYMKMERMDFISISL